MMRKIWSGDNPLFCRSPMASPNSSSKYSWEITGCLFIFLSLPFFILSAVSHETLNGISLIRPSGSMPFWVLSVGCLPLAGKARWVVNKAFGDGMSSFFHLFPPLEPFRTTAGVTPLDRGVGKIPRLCFSLRIWKRERACFSLQINRFSFLEGRYSSFLGV